MPGIICTHRARPQTRPWVTPALRRHPSCDMTWPPWHCFLVGASSPPAGHRQDVCWTVHGHTGRVTTIALPTPSRDKTPFQSIISWALFKHFLFHKGNANLPARGSRRGDHPPRPREKGPSRSLAGILRFRKEQGSGRWEAGYWRVLRLATLSRNNHKT